jgi:2-polyprenyl-3-methyl-5-hydroxy-6-metoxy-1,4-benzoquinol methylase
MGRLVTDRYKLFRELVAGKEVLDVGCVNHTLDTRLGERGKYWLHEHLRQTARHVVGVDYEAADIAKMKQEGYDVVEADATNFDLGRKFDVVVAGEIMEHVVNPAGFLQSVKRHLKPGGFLVTSTPNANCLIFFLENLILGREIDNSDHVCIYSPTTIAKMFEKCGFELKEVIFLAQNTAYLHPSWFKRLLVNIKQVLQVTIGLVRPQISMHFITISAPKGG